MRAWRLRGRFVGFAVSCPTLLRSFSYSSQTGRRHFPFLSLDRVRLLLLLCRPSRPLCGGDPGTAGFAYRAALLWTRVIRDGCSRPWPARAALTELRFDVGYLRRELFELVLITNDGHLQDGGIYCWPCLSWHSGFLRDLILTLMLSSYVLSVVRSPEKPVPFPVLVGKINLPPCFQSLPAIILKFPRALRSPSNRRNEMATQSQIDANRRNGLTVRTCMPVEPLL